jgi:hypothetical protein
MMSTERPRLDPQMRAWLEMLGGADDVDVAARTRAVLRAHRVGAKM